MDVVDSLACTRWACEYHLVFIPWMIASSSRQHRQPPDAPWAEATLAFRDRQVRGGGVNARGSENIRAAWKRS